MRTDYAWCGQGLRRRRACGEAAGDKRHPACGPEHDQPRLGHRWPHDPSPRLCPEPAYPQAHRGGLRLDQSLGRFAQDPPPWARACRMEFHLHRGRLQSDPPPQAAGDLMPSRKNPLLGRWRITEMELWNTDFVDMLEPAYITFEAISTAATARTGYASPGRAMTRWIPPSARAPPNAPQTARSPARSASTVV